MNIKHTDKKSGKTRYHNYRSINQIAAELSQFDQSTIAEYADCYQSEFDKSDYEILTKKRSKKNEL